MLDTSNPRHPVVKTVIQWCINWADSSKAPFCDRNEHPEIFAHRNNWVKAMLAIKSRLPVFNETTGKPEWLNFHPGEITLMQGNHD